MSDNPRSSGHPSDIPSSRYSDAHSGSSGSRGPTGDGLTTPPVSAGPSPGGGHHTRNIVLGAIATIIASTSVYYLTQYVNNRKSSDSTPNHLVMKEATVNAWKRYVIMDNIYYKAFNMMLGDENLMKEDKLLKELFKESATFKKDVGKITGEKNVDPALVSMVNRRIERQTEFEESLTVAFNKLKLIESRYKDSIRKMDFSHPIIKEFFSTNKRLYTKAATEIEQLTKTLSETYGTSFNPDEVMIYADYKKGVNVSEAINQDAPEGPRNYTTNVNPKSLVGNWNDRGNTLLLEEKGTMSYSLNYGERGTGTWKIEDDKLRLDGVITNSQIKKTRFFNLSDITDNSFTMTFNETPFDVFKLKRVK